MAGIEYSTSPQPPSPQGYDLSAGDYSLGEPAEEVYRRRVGHRESVINMARRMADLTIPSVFPPRAFRTGDPLPGNNQSVGARCVNNLASKLMFMAFPPGQPMMRLVVPEYLFQPEIDANPELYSNTLMALSRLEMAHRQKLETTPMRSAYTGFIKQLLVAGNCLWRQMKVVNPTYHRMDQYVVCRDRAGHPLVTVLEEKVEIDTLPEDVKSQILEITPELLKATDPRMKTACIYSVMKLKTAASGEQSWCYWEEYKGKLIDGTEVECDFDDAPMWPAWLIPVFGDDWGRSYCEEYRGDLYQMEQLASSLGDGAALAAWFLTFVDPASRNSVRQIRQAKNLSILSGRATDMSVFRTDKTADLSWINEQMGEVAQRLAAAFLLNSSIQRSAERVTAEEIERMGAELDQAMGGVYSEMAQGPQRRIVVRFVRLNEEETPQLPRMPPSVQIQVVTGIDALGATSEEQTLVEYAETIDKLFPQQAAAILNATTFAVQLGAIKGIKTDGLVNTTQQRQQAQMGDENMAAKMTMLKGSVAPLAKAVAQPLADKLSALSQSSTEPAPPQPTINPGAAPPNG